MADKLAPHEALELHEILRAESLNTTKMQAMMPMVRDNDLKSFMQDSMQRKQPRIQKMREFAQSSVSSVH